MVGEVEGGPLDAATRARVFQAARNIGGETRTLKNDVEVVDADGQVLVSGKVGEWLRVKASGTAVTACIDQGDELLLIALGAGDRRVVQFNPDAL